MRFLLPAALAVVLLTGAGEAQEYSGMKRGASSCGSWTAARKGEMAGGYVDWILGFLAGVGFAGSSGATDPSKGLDAKAVLTWMDNYCQANSLETIAKAGEMFVGAHRLVPTSQEHAQAAPNLDVCESQITDAYHQIDSRHPQALATIAALADMHCKGSPEACSLGANHRRNQINADELEKSEKTRMVLQTIGCFRSWREPSAK